MVWNLEYVRITGRFSTELENDDVVEASLTILSSARVFQISNHCTAYRFVDSSEYLEENAEKWNITVDY